MQLRTITLKKEKKQLVLRLRSRPVEVLPPPCRLPSNRINCDPSRRVTFTPDTVNNENMGRLKSNCCCIWIPPRVFDDPQTYYPNEFETEHCRGHTIPIKAEERQDKNDNENELEKSSCCSNCN